MMTPAGFRHGRIACTVAGLVRSFVVTHNLGVVTGAETGFQIASDPDTVRAPDVAFVCRERIPECEPIGFFPGSPDLAVEILSPNDTAGDVLAKTQDWLDAGCRAVWVVDPQTMTVTVYRSRKEVQVLTRQDDLEGGDLLPGFRVSVESLFV
jgi:Uma2 family endonuclease